MLPTTLKLCRTAHEADPSETPSDRACLMAFIRLPAAERARMMGYLRSRTNVTKPETQTERIERIIRRAEAARRLSCSLRLVDRLAKDGILPKRKFPGRVRASGFLESDLLALIAGK